MVLVIGIAFTLVLATGLVTVPIAYRSRPMESRLVMAAAFQGIVVFAILASLSVAFRFGLLPVDGLGFFATAMSVTLLYGAVAMISIFVRGKGAVGHDGG